jgi:hypothetical protein
VTEQDEPGTSDPDRDDPRERRRRGEGGSSDDDRQPDDTGATGTLGDEGGGTDLNP